MRVAAAGRRHSHKTKIFLLLGGILVVNFWSATVASSDRTTTPLKKGTIMPQVAAVPVRDIPPLDAPQPSRVETFTFGLG